MISDLTHREMTGAVGREHCGANIVRVAWEFDSQRSSHGMPPCVLIAAEADATELGEVSGMKEKLRVHGEMFHCKT
jgi:hypothetical protein